jgi:acid stress-induced BolA-like protein IbaG/YrbA
MLTNERLKTALRKYPGGIDVVEVVGQPQLVATVISGSFEGQDEAVRQESVWAHLEKELSEDELQQIEFIFTDTPAERAAS